MAAPVAVDPTIVIPTVGVEAVGSERGGTVRPPGVGSPVPGSRESSRAFDGGPTRSRGSRDVRTPGDSVAARSDGRAGTTDIRVGAAAGRGALNPIDSAPRNAAGASGGLSRRPVVDRSSPRRIVGTRARTVVNLTSAHSLGSPSTSVTHPRAVAPIRAARAERRRSAERFHPAIAAPETAAIAAPETAAKTTATAEASAAAAKTTTTAEAVERRDRTSGEQNRQKRDERDE